MDGPVRRFRPPEMAAPLLTNPGKGCATFQRFNGDPLYPGEQWSEEGPLAFPPAARAVAEAYLPTAVSYCRWFWEVIEPEDGRLDFSMVEGALATARARGQTLQVRLMPFGSFRQPQLPKWYQDRYPTRPWKPEWAAKAHIEPDYDGKDYFERWGKVVGEFGRRFDGHPDLESVDIAFIGPWGEGAGELKEESVDRFMDLYAGAHRRTHLLVNVDGKQFRSGIARGTGWRCDCFGDLRGRKEAEWKAYTSWNHTFDAYPQMVARAGATDTWKAHPVTFETCATPLGWRNNWYAGMGDLDLVLAQGLKFHASVFMPKSCPIPPEYMEPLAAFCDRMGYRFVLRQALWQENAGSDGAVEAEFWIENTGTAPVYRDVTFALRLEAGDAPAVVPLDAGVRSWLPGDAIVAKTFNIPSRLRGERVRISAGLIRPGSDVPYVRFANDGAGSDGADEAGWLPLGDIVVKP